MEATTGVAGVVPLTVIRASSDHQCIMQQMSANGMSVSARISHSSFVFYEWNALLSVHGCSRDQASMDSARFRPCSPPQSHGEGAVLDVGTIDERNEDDEADE